MVEKLLGGPLLLHMVLETFTLVVFGSEPWRPPLSLQDVQRILINLFTNTEAVAASDESVGALNALELPLFIHLQFLTV